MKSPMTFRLRASFVCYSIFVLVATIFSFVYLFRAEFMPYHAVAIGHNWSELDQGLQNLILGLMKVVGGAWLSVSIAMSILLLKPFRNGESWAYWAIPLIALPSLVVNLFVVSNMALNTPASPPWQVVVINAALLILGFILSVTAKASLNANNGVRGG